MATYTALEADIALISDAVAKEDATNLLAELKAIDAAILKSSATDLQSYSIANRSASRRALDELRAQRDQLKAQIRRACYGSVTLIDMNSNSSETEA